MSSLLCHTRLIVIGSKWSNKFDKWFTFHMVSQLFWRWVVWRCQWPAAALTCASPMFGWLRAYLMCQDVDIMTNVAWRCSMLFFFILTLLRLLHLYLTLHVGLFDYFHLQENRLLSDSVHLILFNSVMICKLSHTHTHTHQLFRPHVVQYPLSILTVMSTLHNCKKKLGGIILWKDETGERTALISFG